MPNDTPKVYTPQRTDPRQRRRRRQAKQQQSGLPRSPRKVTEADKRRTRQRTLLTLYCLLGFELLAVLLTSPLMAVKRVTLEGVENLPASEAAIIEQAVTLPAQTNWLRVSTGGLRDELQTLAYVRKAQVERRFPNRVHIALLPREAQAVAQIGGVSYEVDSEGVPIRQARSESLGRLPLVTLARFRPVIPGKPLNDDALKASLDAYAYAHDNEMVRIAKIEVDQSDNLCLNMRDGIRIRMGSSEEFAEKLALVRRVYVREPTIAQRVAAINLSCPTAPACTPRIALLTPPSKPLLTGD